jgi:hypothetical protein
LKDLEEPLKRVYKKQKFTEEQKRHQLVSSKIIPLMTAYRTLIHMKNIKEGRKQLFVKNLEKFEENGIPYAIAVEMAKGTWKEPEE